MPDNLLVGPDTSNQRIEESTNKAKGFDDDILRDCDTWKEEEKGSTFVSFLSKASDTTRERRL